MHPNDPFSGPALKEGGGGGEVYNTPQSAGSRQNIESQSAKHGFG